MTHASDSRLQQNAWNYFKNVSAETIPAFAVMRVTGTIQVEGMTAITCAKPNSSSFSFYVVNGPAAVRAGFFGQCTYGPSLVVRYSGSPSLDDDLGPTNGSWEISSGGSGFRVVGAINSTILEAIQVPAASASGSQTYAVATFSQAIASNATDEVLEFVTSGGFGITADSINHKFVAVTPGTYFHFVQVLAKATSGGSSGWDILSEADVESVFFNDSAAAIGGEDTLGTIDLDGNSTNRARRQLSGIKAWILDVDDQVWAQVSSGSEDITVIGSEFLWWAGELVT